MAGDYYIPMGSDAGASQFYNTPQVRSEFSGTTANVAAGAAAGGFLGGIATFFGAAVNNLASGASQISQSGMDIASMVSSWKALEHNQDKVVASNVGAMRAQPAMAMQPAGSTTVSMPGAGGGIDMTALLLIGGAVVLIMLVRK